MSEHGDAQRTVPGRQRPLAEQGREGRDGGARAGHEFEMLHRAWKGGVRVPTPARRVENMLSMRYLGTEDGPAPRLHDVRLEDPEPVLEETLAGVEAMARAGVVHTDLSAFNVLVPDGHVWFIDLSEAFRVDRMGTAPRV